MSAVVNVGNVSSMYVNEVLPVDFFHTLLCLKQECCTVDVGVALARPSPEAIFLTIRST